MGIARVACFVAALVCAAAALTLLRLRSWPAWAGAGVVLGGPAAARPSTFLQVGLRDSTAPWFFTNDSTYQIELGGKRCSRRRQPLRPRLQPGGPGALLHRSTALFAARARPRGGAPALRLLPRHTRYGGGWRALLQPFEDYRLFVLVCTLLTFSPPWPSRPARLEARHRRAPRVQPDRRAFVLVRPERRRQPATPRPVVRARHPLALRVGGGEPRRRRPAEAFALVALPFLALMLVMRGADWRCPALVFASVLGAVILPFFLWDPGCLLGRHRQVRRRDLQDRRLRPLGDLDPARDPRGPRGLLPVPALRRRPLAAAHRLAPDGAAKGVGDLGGARPRSRSRCWR